MAVLNDSNWRNDLAPIGVRRGWGPTGHKMMANGGLVTENQLIEVAENNMPEMVVPLSNPALGMQRINEAIAFRIGTSAEDYNFQQLSQIMQLLQILCMLNLHQAMMLQ